MVVASIIIGNHGRTKDDRSNKKYIDLFLEAINEIMITVLFFLMGLEMMVVNANLSVTFQGFGFVLSH